MRFRSLLVAALAVMVFAAGCDKTNDASSDARPTLVAVTISTPAATFADTCNAKAYTYAATAQALLQYAAAYANPALGTNKNGVWTWSITDGALSITVTATKLSNGQYNWKMVFNGSDGSRTYSNWTAMEANASADGKSGNLSIYSDSPTPSTTVDLYVTWATGANNVVTINCEFPSENMKFVMMSNGTNGDIVEYMRASAAAAWVATGFHAVWTTPGATATC